MNGTKDFLKKRNRSNGKKINYKVKFVNEDDNNIKEENLEFNENTEVINEDYIKIGKYWEKSVLLEPKNTAGKLEFNEKEGVIYSLVGNGVQVLEQETLNKRNFIQLEGETIVSFAFNQIKNELICCMENSLIRIFDLSTSKFTKSWKLNKTLARLIKVDLTGKFLAIATAENNILVYDEKYNQICNFAEHRGYIYDLVFNPIKEKYTLYSGSEDNTVKIWDIVLNKCIKTLVGHKASIRHLLLTNDGKNLISVSGDSNIILWKLANYTMIKNFNYDLPIESIIYYTKVNEDQKNKEIIPFLLIASEDGTLGEVNLKNDEDYNTVSFINQPINQLKYMPKMQKLICLTTEQTILIIEGDIVNTYLSKENKYRIYPGYCQELLDIKVINNKHNEFLFTSNDNTLKYYNLDTNQCLLFEGHEDFIMSIDIKENLIATGSKDNTIRVWKIISTANDIFNIKCLAVCKGHSEVVNNAALLLKNRFQLISASKDQTLKLWDFTEAINIYNEKEAEEELEPLEITESLHSEMAHDEEVGLVRISKNEKLIASGAYDKLIKIWNNKLEIITTLKGHKRAITDIQFSSYVKILASSSTDKTIKLWNLSDYTCINTFEGHLSSVLRINWIYFGTHLVSTGADGLIKFWNIKNSECMNTIDAHEGKIWALDVVNKDESKPLLITGGTDSKILIWQDITKETEVKELKALEDKIQKEQLLKQLNMNKEYYQAMNLSLELNRKSDFIYILRNYISSNFNNRAAISTPFDINEHINAIINNRKALEDDIKILDEKTNINSILKDPELRKVISSNLDRVLEIIRDFNIKASNFFYVQVLLKLVMITNNYNAFLSKKEVGKKNKGLKKKRNKEDNNENIIDYLENFKIINAYSEKHIERINRELTRSCLLDYILNKIKIT